MLSQAGGFQDSISSATQTFEDIPNSHPYWLYVERLNLHGIANGYTCGQADYEPCGPTNRPYFRPQSLLLRGDALKMTVLAFPNNLEGCSLPQRPSNPSSSPTASSAAATVPKGTPVPSIPVAARTNVVPPPEPTALSPVELR
jgi:hypothetical protein